MKRFAWYGLISVLLISMVPVQIVAADEIVAELAPVSENVIVIDAEEEALTEEPPMTPPVDIAMVEVASSELSREMSSAATPPPPAVETKVLISEVRLRGCLVTLGCSSTSQQTTFIELYNPSPMPVTIANWALHYVVARDDGTRGGSTMIATINATLDGYGYALVGNNLTGADAPRDESGGVLTVQIIPLTGLVGNSTKGYIELTDREAKVIDSVGWGTSALLAEGGHPTRAPELNNSVQRCETLTGRIVDSDDNKNDFLQYQVATPGQGVMCLQPEPPVVVTTCEGVHISEIGANVATESQFIELHNNTRSDIAIGGCLLQTNRSLTKTYILPANVMAADSYLAVAIKDTGLTLTKTTSGTVYLLSSDGKAETDTRSYSNLMVDTSWSWFGGNSWLQTYAKTPNAVNSEQLTLPCEDGYLRSSETGRCNKIVTSLPPAPCRDDQYRSEETNRCRNIVTATSSLVACRDNQYRSEETNRCRNVVTASASLVPCKDTQYRSEETNRCRNIASTATNLVPCKDNQYRSEETNRCRTIAATTIPDVGFAAAPVKEGAKAFVGWWVLGGVGVLAAGYGVWEWRRELKGMIRKITGVFATKT